MQQLKKQREPVVQEKTPGDIERERIADAYDKKHGKGIYQETDNPGSDEFYLDPAEKRELYKEKLTGPESPLERSKATREEIYAKHSAPEEEVSPPDAPPDPDEAIADFRARHPEITDGDWQILDDRAFHAKAPDVWEMQQNLKHSATRKDMDLLLERALDGLKAYKTEQARRAEYQRVAQQSFKSRGM